ncbi:MAG: XdhC family protein [Clostridia bacterium]|nr:XdhC family protein [Clostridia bacterium]
MENIFAKIDEIKSSGQVAALCIVTATSGSAPRKAGAKMIVTAQGVWYGTIGGGQLERQVTEKALELCRQRQQPVTLHIDLKDDMAMHCGGSVSVYVEPLLPDEQLVIFGAGHVGASLARLARMLGFAVTLVDHRENLTKPLIDDGFEVIAEDYITAANNLATDEQRFLVVTTPQHKYDQEVTGILAQKPYRYLGMIGSRRKVAEAQRYYLENNILDQLAIDKINMPIGIPFNAQTPAEIAVSILAKIIDVRNS